MLEPLNQLTVLLFVLTNLLLCARCVALTKGEGHKTQSAEEVSLLSVTSMRVQVSVTA